MIFRWVQCARNKIAARQTNIVLINVMELQLVNLDQVKNLRGERGGGKGEHIETFFAYRKMFYIRVLCFNFAVRRRIRKKPGKFLLTKISNINIVLGNLIPAINSTSQGPFTYGGHSSFLLVDRDVNTFQHTYGPYDRAIVTTSWWKATFKTTVFITSFTIVARFHSADCCAYRLNNLEVSTVVYSNFNQEKSSEILMVRTNSLTTIENGIQIQNPHKTFTVSTEDGIKADEILIKKYNADYVNIAELYIEGY